MAADGVPAVKFTRAHAARLPDVTAEAIRSVHDQQIRELQTESGAVRALPGRLLAVRRLTGSGTYVPTTGTTRVRAWLQAPGGGGGGGGGGAGIAAGGGGGAGALLDVFVGSVGVAMTGGAYACGAGGAGGSNAGGNGGNGGDLSIAIAGVTYIAKGASGGAGMASSTLANAIGGIGQAGSTTGPAVLSESTARGEHGFVVGGGGFPGGGASSRFGTGGVGSFGGFAAGSAASGFGSGGGGAQAGAAGFAGGAGAPGVIVVEEFG